MAAMRSRRLWMASARILMLPVRKPATAFRAISRLLEVMERAAAAVFETAMADYLFLELKGIRRLHSPLSQMTSREGAMKREL